MVGNGSTLQLWTFKFTFHALIMMSGLRQDRITACLVLFCGRHHLRQPFSLCLILAKLN